MRLIYIATGQPVQLGDVHCIDLRSFRVAAMPPPTTPASQGQIDFEQLDGWPGPVHAVHVIGAEWVEREDRGEAPDVPGPHEPWRVESAGPPAERRHYAMRRKSNGDLEFMHEDNGDVKEFPSAAAALTHITLTHAQKGPRP